MIAISHRKDTPYILMAIGSNTIFGFSFLFSKLALGVADTSVLLALRFTAAFLLMTLLRLTGLVPCCLKGKNLRSLLLLGFLQPILYFPFESYGILLTSSSFAGILIALIPIAGTLLGCLFLHERPTALQLLCSCLSVGGVIIMTTAGGVSGFSAAGLLCLLGAVFSAAAFAAVSRGISSEFTAFERTYVMFAEGTVVFVALALLRTGCNAELWLKPLHSGTFWLSLVYLAGFSSVGAFLLMNKALSVLEVSRSLVFNNITTVISVLAGVILLHESFSAVQAAGVVIALAGVYGVNRFTKQE